MTLRNLFLKTAVVFLGLCLVIFKLVPFFFINGDYVFNLFYRPHLEGNLCYSSYDQALKVVELSSLRKEVIWPSVEQDRRTAAVFSSAYSPDGRKIAAEINVYQRPDGAFSHDLYLIGNGGRQKYKLLELGINISAPSWSSNGQKIAFNLYERGWLGLYVTEVKNGYKIARIYDKKILDPISWTPDDQKIIFHSVEVVVESLGNNRYSSRDYGGVCIINIDGSGFRKLIDRASSAVLSPRGDRIVYEKQFSYYLAEFKDGQVLNAKRFVSCFPYWTPYMLPLSFSPDGKYLVFAKPVWFDVAGIYVAPVDNPSKQYRIGTEYIPVYSLSWGKKV